MASKKPPAKAKAPAQGKAKRATPTKSTRGGAAVARPAHSRKDAGSIPAPASKTKPKAATSTSAKRPFFQREALEAITTPTHQPNPRVRAATPEEAAAFEVRLKVTRAKAPPKPKEPESPVVPMELTPMQKWRARDEDEALSELCEHVIEGGHLASFCKERDLKYTTMLDWINERPRRTEMYARAREDRSDRLADEIISISDDAKSDTYVDSNGVTRTDTEVVQRSKIRVDARKWIAAKLKPRVYGDKLTLDAKVDHSKVSDDELKSTLAKYGIAVTIGPKQDEATDA